MSTFDVIKKALGTIKVVSPEAAEESVFVICGYPPGNFPDDVCTFCSECGMGIVHRPTAPKKPRKICSHCAMILVPRLVDKELVLTGKTIEEVVTFINNSQAGADLSKKKMGL